MSFPPPPPLSVMLLLLLLSLANAQQLFECPPEENCGPFGKCVHAIASACPHQPGRPLGGATQHYPGQHICGKHCQCDPGYWGADCSEAITHCPRLPHTNSTRVCMNGGTCFETQELHKNQNGTKLVQVYRCDCRQATGEAATYAGHKCEYGLETSCESGKDHSDYAFCVNGGTCRHTVEKGQPFLGCNCQGTQFEGRHCQYSLGSAPEEEIVYVAKDYVVAKDTAAVERQNNSNKKRGGGLLLFALAVVVFGLVAAVVYAYKRSSSSSRGRTSTAPPPPPSEIQLSSQTTSAAEEEFHHISLNDGQDDEHQVV